VKKIKKKSSTLYCLTIGCLLLIFMFPVMGSAPGDLIFEREDQSQTSTFPPSVFPHWKHRIRYRCDACHDSLFNMQPGVTPITMETMKNGENCGTCHNGKQAFDVGFSHCSRCHRVVSD
jgi:c(7)-type cytochrome triheme protein